MANAGSTGRHRTLRTPVLRCRPCSATTWRPFTRPARFVSVTCLRGARTVLSVGASGAWYFDWFDRAYGAVERHIAVEAFLPRPDELPENVEWLAADLAGPDGVASVDSGSVDLVFSGQNIEHLWPNSGGPPRRVQPRAPSGGLARGRQSEPKRDRGLPLDHGGTHRRNHPRGGLPPT